MKAEPSGLIPRKPPENLELLFVVFGIGWRSCPLAARLHRDDV